MTTAGNDAEIAYLESLLEAAINPKPETFVEDCWRAVDAAIAAHRQGQLTSEDMESLVAVLAAAAIGIEAESIVAEYFSPSPRRAPMFGLGS